MLGAVMATYAWRVSFMLNEAPIERWSEIWNVDGIVSFAKIESIAVAYLAEQYNDSDPIYAEIESIESLGAISRHYKANE